MGKIFVVLAIAVLVVIFAPFLTIWSLNTLFPTLAIPYTLETWSAIILLGMAVRGESLVSSKK